EDMGGWRRRTHWRAVGIAEAHSHGLQPFDLFIQARYTLGKVSIGFLFLKREGFVLFVERDRVAVINIDQPLEILNGGVFGVRLLLPQRSQRFLEQRLLKIL